MHSHYCVKSMPQQSNYYCGWWLSTTWRQSVKLILYLLHVLECHLIHGKLFSTVGSDPGSDPQGSMKLESVLNVAQFADYFKANSGYRNRV